MRLYYHKTDGGAEYLLDTFIECPNGHKEGAFTDDTKFVVRIDGNIQEDAELTFRNLVIGSLTEGDLKSVANYIAAEISFQQIAGGEDLDQDEIEMIVENELRDLDASRQISN